jgi:hypothetical protein
VLSVCSTVRRLQGRFDVGKHWKNTSISNFLQILSVRRLSEKAVITAVNREHDAGTTGTLTNQLANRIYGCSSFPDWIFDGLYENDQIQYLASELHGLNK